VGCAARQRSLAHSPDADERGKVRGHPTPVAFSAVAHDEAAAVRLWAVSEQLTGVTIEALAAR